MIPHLAAPFWTNPLTTGERTLIYYFLVIAGIALLAMFVRTWTSISEIGSRYRPAMFASLGVTGVAFLSYVVLVVKFDLGYDQQGGSPTGAGSMWIPNKEAIWSWAPRYMDWSITVPLLMVEIVAVSALVGLAATRMRALLMGSAFLMIFTGYLGGVVLGDGASLAALWTWGLISAVFMAILYVLLLTVLVGSQRQMPPRIASTFRMAVILQLVVFFVYPIVFGFQGYTDRLGGWTVFAQVTLSIADVVAKVGFGLLLLRVARIRTAADVLAGEDVHPEGIWIDQLRQSDGVAPRPAQGALPGD